MRYGTGYRAWEDDKLLELIRGGASYQEVAEVLGRTPESARQRWRRLTQPVKPRRIIPRPEIDEWGRGPIARMTDRVKADDLINEHFYRVHNGQKFEDVKFRRVA